MNTLNQGFYKKASRVCLLSILLLLSTFYSCKKDNKEDGPEQQGTAIISIGAAEVKGYEVQTLEVEGLTLLYDEYVLNIGGKEVKGFKATPDMLVFMLPFDLATGRHKLTIPFASNKIEINYTAPDKITDPAAVLNDFLGDVGGEYEAAAALTDDPLLLQKLKEQRDAQKEVPTRLAQLSDEEQQVVAQVILANRSIFDELDEALAELEDPMYLAMSDAGLPLAMTLKGNEKCGFSCKNQPLLKVLAGVAAIVAAFVSSATVGSFLLGIGGAVLILDVVFDGKISARLVCIKDAVSKFLNTVYFPQIEYLKRVLDDFSDKLFRGIETKSGLSGLRILKGEPFHFALQPVFRTVERSDAEHSEYGALIKPLIVAYDKTKAIYDTYLKEDYGEFPDFVKREERVPAKALSEWAVAVTQGTDVTVSEPVGDAANFSVEFNTKQGGEQPFTFTVMYDNGDFSTTETFTGTLVPQREPYTLEILTGDNQRGQLGERLPESLKVVVKDAKGGVLEDIDVQWSVKSGGGTLIGAEPKTNAEGIAQAEWQLGESGEQEVEVTVSHHDGDPVQGSPLVFTMQQSLIVGKWFIDKVIQYEYLNGALIDVSEEDDYVPGSYFEFKADGTLFIDYLDEDGTASGTYRLSEDGKTLFVDINCDDCFSDETTIKALSNQQMTLYIPSIGEDIDEETGGVYTWALDVHFKK